MTTSPDRAGLPLDRWINSLHEDANGLVWITKAELRAALATTGDSEGPRTRELPVHAPTCMGYDANDGPCAVSGWAEKRTSPDPAGLLREALNLLRSNERTLPNERYWEGWDAALAAVEVALATTVPPEEKP